MPLLFKSDHPILPNNHYFILKRSLNTLYYVRRNAQELDEALKFTRNNIKNGYVEQVPVSDPPPEDGKSWWLPAFPIHHPKKGKICLVFDSFTHYMGISLNSVSLQGPGRNNCLHGILSRFREGEVAFMADIEPMFHRFQVAPEHSDCLCFFWF